TIQFVGTGARGQTADRLAVLAAWWTTDLRRGAGLWQPWGESPRDLGVMMATLIVAALGWALLERHPRWTRMRPLDGALLMLLTIPFVSMLSGFGSLVINPWGFDATGRYTLPIWGGLAIVLGAFLAAVSHWRRLAGLAIAGTLLALNLFGWLVADPVQAFQSA